MVTVLTIFSIVIFIVTLVKATLYAPDVSGGNEPAQTTSTSDLSSTSFNEVADIGLPLRLYIPTLNIDAHIQQVGIRKDGSIGIPNNFTDVAWYKGGTVPGQKGTAIIDGHVDNGLGLSGVFKYLSRLAVGSDIYINTTHGSTLHFVVTNISTYDFNDSSATKEIFSQADMARITLITCEGDWVYKYKTYNKRLVVTADRVQ